MTMAKLRIEQTVLALVLNFLMQAHHIYSSEIASCSGTVPSLVVNKAFLTVSRILADSNNSIVLQLQSKECIGCDLKNYTLIPEGQTSCTVLVDTRWPVRVQILPEYGENLNEDMKFAFNYSSCNESRLGTFFREGGNYTIYVTAKNNAIRCMSITLRNDPADSNIPIYVAIGIYGGLAIIWIILKRIYRIPAVRHFMFHCINGSDGLIEPHLGTPTNISEDEDALQRKPRKERLKSLDTFRGISIVVMIFVNYGGGSYWFFNHSKWNGLTVADLVFPWFVFIMGTSMAYSFQSLVKKSTPVTQIFVKIFKRSVILFAFGLLINASDDKAVALPKFRIPGVLQRFAGTYLLTASVHLIYHMFFDLSADTHKYTKLSWIRDVTDYWPEWIVNLTFVTIHLVLTFHLQVPGCPVGYIGPGGDADQMLHRNCTGGAASYIDRKIFGDAHIYHSPTCKEIYNTFIPHDPEGLLGTLNSCFICFLGLQAGKILIKFKDWKSRVYRFICWGIILGGIATLLCKASKEDGWIPVNKNLWSLSFVLLMASFAFFLLTFCYIMVDVYNIWSGAPFYYPGMNSIVLYMGHEIWGGKFPVFWSVPSTHVALLSINLWGTTFWVMVSTFLFYKGIFLSI